MEMDAAAACASTVLASSTTIEQLAQATTTEPIVLGKFKKDHRGQ
jgi:hypothetical protein